MPDFTFEVNPRWSRLPLCSAVLNGFPRDYLVHDYRTTLSIKTVVRGAAWYHTAAGHYRLDEESFLLLNHDQTYSMEVGAASGTETLCPFFQRGFLEHAALALDTPADRLLDEIEPPSGTVGFCERLYPKRGSVARHLAAIREALQGGPVPADWLEDRFFALALDLLRLDRQVRSEIAAFPGSRPSTRAELYRRLHRGRDLLASCYDQPLTVAMAARAAHLSPFHFQRMWKLAFGETPMQFLQARRLAVAKRLLATTEEDVTQIALAVGFESLGSFSWLFRRRFGISPRGFRAAADRC